MTAARTETPGGLSETPERRRPFGGSGDLAAAGDVSLVVAVARGSQPALAEIFRRHGGAVHQLARRVVGPRGLAEDVTQDVFVGLWCRPERYDATRGTLRTYLMAVAHGRAIDLLRAEASRARRERRHGSDVGLAPSPPSLEDRVGEAAGQQELRRVVDGLPEDERRAIQLAYFGGHSYREVATILGAAEGTVKSRIRRGLRRLHGALRAETARGAQA